MFGWWKNKSTISLSSAQQQVLDSFQTDDMPVVISELATDISFRDNRLVIQLPFAAQAILQPLQQALADAGFSGEVSLSYQNPLPFSVGQTRQVILVASGKGGVGKSTTAVNLAIALAQQGAKVGLLDADIYGPSIPTMLGLAGTKATSPDEKHLSPVQKYGIFMQSIGFLVDPQLASVWRGPMASQALLQLLNETLWPELDYLVVDMPPGTGDIQLTLSQKLPVSGAVIVTTPQDVALADAQKGIAMFRQVNIPLLGLIENMSYYQCSSCGHIDDIFGTRGGVALAERYQVPVLGQLPLQKQIRQCSDEGTPIVLNHSEQSAEIYQKIARQLIFALYWQARHKLAQQPQIIITDD